MVQDEPEQIPSGNIMDELATILAAGFLRLRAKHVGTREKREISEIRRDYNLEVPPKPRPCVVDL
ncbi:MAG: hypothetical protein HZA50_17895 [Planctomycetes bacterium]|nr:hypothetical protein [Planctomycetota bacterium]